MTAGSEFVPVVDDHLVNRLAAVPSLERDKHRVRAVANRLQDSRRASRRAVRLRVVGRADA
jgi:CheY-like chemotaxis protein